LQGDDAPASAQEALQALWALLPASARLGEGALAMASELDYHSLGWGDKELTRLSRVISFSVLRSLQSLWISDNLIGDAGLSVFALAIRGDGVLPQLSILKAANNSIGDAGVAALARSLADGALAQLKELWLYCNAITDGGGLAIAEAARAGALSQAQVLSLNGNSIGEAGLNALVDSLGDGLESIWEFRLQNNPGMTPELFLAAQSTLDARAGRLKALAVHADGAAAAGKAAGTSEVCALRVRLFERQSPLDAAAAATSTLGHILHPDVREYALGVLRENGPNGE
jgi:hypothetical protein